MRIFKRLSDIVSSNLNDLLDRAEDPAKMVTQILREMEEGLEAARRVTTQTVVDEKKLQKELDRNRALVGEWQRRAVQAVEAGRDDLAKKALARKMEIESVLGSLGSQHETAKATAEQMKGTLKALEARLAEAKRRQATLVARKKLADAKRTVATNMDRARREEGDLAAFARFDRMARKVEDTEAEAEARLEVAGETLEVEELGASEQIEEELKKLKDARKPR